MTTDAGVIRHSPRGPAGPSDGAARSAGHHVPEAGVGAEPYGVPDDAFRDGSPDGPSGEGPVGPDGDRFERLRRTHRAARRGTCIYSAAMTCRTEAGQSRRAEHRGSEAPLAATDDASIHASREAVQEGSP